jgi:hypothetical protein
MDEHVRRSLLTAGLILALGAAPARAQETQEGTRAGTIAQQQAEKAKTLHPPVESEAERIISRLQNAFMEGQINWHPFFQSAYAGGGFTLGAGYARHVSSYNTIDFRGSITFSGYKRVEAEFRAPRLFDRRGVFSLIGGWREATQVAFHGIGNDTIEDARVNYSFEQPYLTADLDFRPTRRYLVFHAGAEYTTWDQGPASGGQYPSIEQFYTPATLQGMGASPTYLHTSGGLGLDWRRPGAGYARSGGLLEVIGHDYSDSDDDFGFQQVDYDIVQHLPLFRNMWVLSLHGRVETSWAKDGQTTPFFMLPALGGGSSLRGFASWRFRDNHSLLMQAEWRVLANNFLDMAVFYDTGKVASRTKDLDLDDLKSNYGLGFRLHSFLATPIRIELAKSDEGLAIVFSSKAAF